MWGGGEWEGSQAGSTQKTSYPKANKAEATGISFPSNQEMARTFLHTRREMVGGLGKRDSPSIPVQKTHRRGRRDGKKAQRVMKTELEYHWWGGREKKEPSLEGDKQSTRHTEGRQTRMLASFEKRVRGIRGGERGE